MTAKANSGSRTMRRSTDRSHAGRIGRHAAGRVSSRVCGRWRNRGRPSRLAFLLALDAGLGLHVLGGQLGEEAGIRDAFPAHGDAGQAGMHDEIGVERGAIGVVEHRVEFDDLEADQVVLGAEPAHHRHRLAHRQAAGHGRAGARHERRVEHVDVKGDVDLLAALARLRQRAFHDGVPAALFDLGHRVIAHPVVAHPFEAVRPRPGTAQPDLDEVLRLDVSFLHRPIDGRAVRDEMRLVLAGVEVRIEVHDAETALAVHVREAGDVRVFQAVVTADDERQCARPRDFRDALPHVVHRALRAHVVDGDVAVVDDVQFLGGIDHRVHVDAARAVLVAHRHRPEALTAVVGTHVERRADDRDVDLARHQVFRVDRDRCVGERANGSAAARVVAQRNWSGLAPRD